MAQIQVRRRHGDFEVTIGGRRQMYTSARAALRDIDNALRGGNRIDRQVYNQLQLEARGKTPGGIMRRKKMVRKKIR